MEGGRALASQSKVLAAGLDARFTVLAEALNDVLSATGSPAGTTPQAHSALVSALAAEEAGQRN